MLVFFLSWHVKMSAVKKGLLFFTSMNVFCSVLQCLGWEMNCSTHAVFFLSAASPLYGFNIHPGKAVKLMRHVCKHKKFI